MQHGVEETLPPPSGWKQESGPRCHWGFPGGSDGKEFACSARDSGSIPGLGRSPGEGNGYPLQYSCLENPLDRGTWWATVQGVTESDMSERLTPPPPPPRRRQYSILLGASWRTGSSCLTQSINRISTRIWKMLKLKASNLSEQQFCRKTPRGARDKNWEILETTARLNGDDLTLCKAFVYKDWEKWFFLTNAKIPEKKKKKKVYKEQINAWKDVLLN